MYAVLALYGNWLPLDEPLVCVDEKSIQLLAHSRKPLLEPRRLAASAGTGDWRLADGAASVPPDLAAGESSPLH